MIESLKDFVRNVRYGIRNLWRFRKAIWAWRGWDWWCNYELFVESLKLTRGHIAKCRNHKEWQEDVDGINRLLHLWEMFNTAAERLWDGTNHMEVHDEEERLWAEMHEHLKENARKWWD